MQTLIIIITINWSCTLLKKQVLITLLAQVYFHIDISSIAVTVTTASTRYSYTGTHSGMARLSRPVQSTACEE